MTTPTQLAATTAALRSATESVRALTLHQPWAASVAWLGKDIENRSWPAPCVGLLLLVHAGLQADRDVLRETPADLEGRNVRGAVVAVTRLTACHRNTCCQDRCSTWADPDSPWHWELADTLPLSAPVPATGARRLWVPTSQLRTAIATALEDGADR